MGDQTFSLTVPNTNVTIAAGKGCVPGIALTTGANVFIHAGGGNFINEASADMRLASTAVLGAAATGGVVIGTPASIQASAGGGVQIYAGAGITPSLGGPSGPGAPFGASAPAKVDAGKIAESRNKFNDVVKGVGDIASAGLDWKSAATGWDKVKAGIGIAKGAWETQGAAGGYKNAGVDAAFGVVGIATGGAQVLMDKDAGKNLEAITGAVTTGLATFGLVDDAVQKANVAGRKADYDKKLKDAKAGAQATSTAGNPGGSMGAPADGPRIHEVAPANIDRETGANMTAKVAGDMLSDVDGNIKYQAGASISMKAFSAVKTQSLTFSAHANVSASMKGLATAKVESLGLASLKGVAKFSISSSAAGSIKAPKIDIDTAKLTVKSTQTTIGPGTVEIGPGTVTIKAPLKVTGKTEISNTVQIAKKTEIKGPIHCAEMIKARGNIESNATLKNKYFTSG